MSADSPTRAARSTRSEAEARAAQPARSWPQIAFWLLVAIVGIGGFIALTALVWSHTPFPFDQPLLDLARGWNGWSPLWNALSVAAYLPLLAVTVAFVLWLWWRHRRREAVLAVVILVIVTACSEAVKELVARPRPPASTEVVPGVVYSFPSGHVLEVASIFGFIAVLMWRGSLPRSLKLVVTFVLSALVVLVAIARVSLNAHYPSDVLAGFVGAVGVVAVFVLLTWRRDRDRRRAMAEKAAANSAPQVAAPSGPSKLTIVLGFAAISGCLVILGVLADIVKAQEADALDALATPLVHQYASPTLDAFMNDVTALGSNQVLVILIVVAAGSLLVLRRRRDALLLAVALGGSVALNALMKAFFERPRPQLAWAHVLPDFSFPSGHSMDSVVFYFALALLVWQIAGRGPGVAAAVAAMVLVLLIGLSRIYLGYHYFTDVIGGYIAGALWLVVVVSAFSGPERIRAWRDVRAASVARP